MSQPCRPIQLQETNLCRIFLAGIPPALPSAVVPFSHVIQCKANISLFTIFLT